jgi:uncharacterized protein YuzE
MKIEYEKEDDVLMIWFSKATKFDYAEQKHNVIIHYSKDNDPVLMEILDASSFLMKTSDSLPFDLKHQIFQ